MCIGNDGFVMYRIYFSIDSIWEKRYKITLHFQNGIILGKMNNGSAREDFLFLFQPHLS